MASYAQTAIIAKDTKSAGVPCSMKQPVNVELIPAAKLRGGIFGAIA
jgi:hypothetical protein